MKKVGFTLAEVLVTLGIIGVISALTLPTFTQKTSNAKIGPQLSKAVSTYEQAAKAVLAAEDTDSILAVASTPEDFMTKMSRYMNGSQDTTHLYIFYSADGVRYDLKVEFRTPLATDSEFAKEVPLSDNTKGDFLMIDINGDSAPNKKGRDAFFFTPWSDGSLRPVGAYNWYTWNKSGFNTFNNNDLWSASGKCPNGLVPTDAIYCAGSIFANGLQVKYK